MVSCQPNNIINETVDKSSIENQEESIKQEETTQEEITVEDFIYTYASKEEAALILASEDDYIVQLSAFDYASKFNSTQALDYDGRLAVYRHNTLEWRDDQKAVVDKAMINVTAYLEAMEITIPHISFALTSIADEGGAAYTRQNMIVLKPHHVSVYSQGLEDLILHEFFHIYSRMNKELRPAMYAIIGYQTCDPLIPPDQIKDLMISNPDAPDNNFYITGLYQGENLSFIPIIYSSEAYEIDSGRSFFETLNDDMLGVTIVNGKPEVILNDGQLLIVKKEEIEDFYDKVGRNTSYTYHPEETMADNFVFLAKNMTVRDMHILEELKKVLK